MSARILLVAVSVICLLPAAAQANGLFETKSWQFQNSADITARILMEDLRLKQKGGFYHAVPPTYNSQFTTNNNTPVASMTTVTAGNGTSVTITSSSSNGGTLIAGGTSELNGSLSP
jgi:hypothetical protein